MYTCPECGGFLTQTLIHDYNDLYHIRYKCYTCGYDSDKIKIKTTNSISTEMIDLNRVTKETKLKEI